MKRAGGVWRLIVVALALICLGTATFLGAGAASLAAPATTVVCPRVAAPILIDGLTGDWGGIPVLGLDATNAGNVQGAPSGLGDISAALRCAWDEQKLYVLTDVADSVLIVDSSTIGDDDGVEIALDGDHNRTCCSVTDHQYTIALDSRLADFGAVQGPSPLQWTVMLRPGGYSLEVAIPMALVVSGPPLSGTLLGFNLGINDDDDGGRRDKHLLWADTLITTVSAYGDMLLAGPSGSATSTPTASATVVAPATPTSTPTLPRTATPTTTRTLTSTRTQTPTQPASPPTVTATPTQPASPQPGSPTPGTSERIAALEGHVAGLSGALNNIWSIMQTAGSLPGGATPVAPSPSATPTSYIMSIQTRVNCGGANYTDNAGNEWAADQPYTAASWGYIGGTAYQTTRAISATLADPLYQSERFNMTAYQFDLPSGIYRVDLRFDEIYDFAAANQRIFDVALEGVKVITGLDLYVVAGPFTAYDRSFDVTVLDGQLNIDFLASKGTAKINAIAVSGIGYAGPTPTPSLQQRLNAIDSSLTDLELLLQQILSVFDQFLSP